MENKPIVTCHGDQNLFSRLHPAVVQGLPREPVEWRRSYGRPPRSVQVEANFVPFNPDILLGDEDWSLLGRPFFHTYWTDCDIEGYKTGVKEDINEWLSVLKAKNIPDWLIIIMVNEENKVKTKLLRTSVYDKVKGDFCGKQTDRCIVLTEPFKPDSKSAESWNLVLARLRHLLLQSYNRHLGRFEEHMRTQRESRQEPGWNFCNYFLLQEELAFMFEMLRLYEESLVQYDELDALFTQFILNHVAGDTSDWLSTFTSTQHQTWDGLCLSQPINIEKRLLIKKCSASLLDFRNYLFARQCTLLFMMVKPWEVAHRAIPFMHNSIQELGSLEIKMPEGATSCWVFLSCLEILNTFETYNKTGHMESHSLYTASLWDYARNKIQILAKVLGLLPGTEQSAAQAALGQHLIEGGTFDNYREEGDAEPIQKLKEALSSKESFQKHYLELSELAMGTYKHIGRIRSARQIGKDLATYYMSLGEWQKAEGFLQDALKTYKEAGWEMLADHTRIQIAECQKAEGNLERFVRSCTHIAGSKYLPDAARRSHQEQMMALAKQFESTPIQVRSGPVLTLRALEPEADCFILHKECLVRVRLACTLLDPVPFTRFTATLIQIDPGDSVSINSSLNQSDGFYQHRAAAAGAAGGQSRRARHPSMASMAGIEYYNHEHESVMLWCQRLDLVEQCELKPDQRTVASCGLSLAAGLMRSDSGQPYRERQLEKEDTELGLQARDIVLQPGDNVIELTGRMPEEGTYTLSQLCLSLPGLEFLTSLKRHQAGFQVVCDEPEILCRPLTAPLTAGVPQAVTLTLMAGSYALDQGSELMISPPDGVTISGPDAKDCDERRSKLILPQAAKPYDQISFDIILESKTPECDDRTDFMNKELIVVCPALDTTFAVDVVFHRPWRITHALHTAGHKKFIQIALSGLVPLTFTLEGQRLSTESMDAQLVPLNKEKQVLSLTKGRTVSYIWRLEDTVKSAPPLHCHFAVHYGIAGGHGDEALSHSCQYDFQLEGYVTLYVANLELKPPAEGALCQAGTMYHVTLSVCSLLPEDAHDDDDVTLLYDVDADVTLWGMSGKTSGLFKLKGGSFEVELEAMPLMGGFLPLPKVTLSTYVGPQESPQKTVEDENEVKPVACHGKLVPFLTGQVYYASAARQVKVIPACNTSSIDITMVT